MKLQPQPGFRTSQNFRANDWLAQKSQPTIAAVDDDGASPFLVEFFMVQGVGFRCMAYQDQDGQWRRAFYNEELAGCIQIVE